MKIIVACDSYKGCMTSREVADNITAAIHRVDPAIDVVSYTMADGGEGTAAAFCDACGGEMVEAATTNAYGRKISAQYALIEDGRTAVIEAAGCIGLAMHPREKRNPLMASSFGVGTLMLDAQRRGCRRIIVGLGGTATNDGGMGLLQSLGARFYDEHHQYLSPQAVNLEKVRYIDFNRLNLLEDIELTVACDVKNHLLGKAGATYTFGKQKGLYPAQLERVDQGMRNFRDQVKRYRHIDLDAFEGGGAAGGIGAVLIGLLGARMVPGIELLLSYSTLEKEIADCDLVITGEGQSDAQTLMGKVPAGVAEAAKRHGALVVALAGCVTPEARACNDHGIDAYFPILQRPCTEREAMELSQASANLEATAAQVFHLITACETWRANS